MALMNSIIDYVNGLGFAYLLPLMVLIMALILKVKLGKAIVSALTIGVGFVGMGILISYFHQVLSPAVLILAEKMNGSVNIVDMGWAIVATSAFSTPIGVLVLPLALLINYLMLKIKWTKTFNLDIWNFWHFAFTSSIVYIVSGGSVNLSLVAASIHCIFTLVVADFSAKNLQTFFNVPSVSAPQGWLVTSVPLVWVLDWIVERIPGLRDIEWKPDRITKTLGFLGQPTVLGILLGLIIGLIAYGLSPSAFVFALQISSLMLLIPSLVPFFKEGLTPLSDATREFFIKHFGEMDHYDVIDYGVLMGHPNNGAAGLILMLVTLIIAFLLPGVTTLPLADLAITAFFVAMIPPLTNGNLFRSIFYGIVIMLVVLFTSNALAPDFSMIATTIGINGSDVLVTSLAGGNWLVWILARIASIF